MRRPWSSWSCTALTRPRRSPCPAVGAEPPDPQHPAARSGGAVQRSSRAPADRGRLAACVVGSSGTSRSLPAGGDDDPPRRVDHLQTRRAVADRHRVRQPVGVDQRGDPSARRRALESSAAGAGSGSARAPAARRPSGQRHREHRPRPPAVSRARRLLRRRHQRARPARPQPPSPASRYPGPAHGLQRVPAERHVDLAAQVADVDLDHVGVGVEARPTRGPGSRSWTPPRRRGGSGTPAARTPAASARPRSRPGRPGAGPGPATGPRPAARPAAARRRAAAAPAAGPASTT